jgi:hypothetical protein
VLTLWLWTYGNKKSGKVEQVRSFYSWYQSVVWVYAVRCKWSRQLDDKPSSVMTIGWEIQGGRIRITLCLSIMSDEMVNGYFHRIMCFAKYGNKWYHVLTVFIARGKAPNAHRIGSNSALLSICRHELYGLYSHSSLKTKLQWRKLGV